MAGRRAFRPVRAALVVALLVDLVVLGADLYLLDGVSETTQVDLEDALVDFRSDGPAEVVTSAPAGGAEATPVPGVDVATSPSTSAPVAPGSTAPPPPGDASPAPTVAAPVVAFAPPAEGVYRYRTTGGEAISVLGARHDYPAETYASVRHEGGCRWRMRAELVREHVDERSLCSEPGRLLQHEQARLIEFFGTRDGGTYTCDPAQVQHAEGDLAGASAAVDCGDGKGSWAHLVRTTVGTGEAVVDGVSVPVVRLRVDGTLSGRVRGTSTDLLTVVAATGLPVVWERTVDTVADAFGSSVRYREHARFDLASLTPQT
jgi:hypothetical protein